MLNLPVKFYVNEDLPSERKRAYEELVGKALDFFLDTATEDEKMMIDRMFWDGYRDDAFVLRSRTVQAIRDGAETETKENVIKQDGAIALLQKGPDDFTVIYGKQRKEHLDYGQACEEMGTCILHQLACDGKIDNSEAT